MFPWCACIPLSARIQYVCPRSHDRPVAVSGFCSALQHAVPSLQHPCRCQSCGCGTCMASCARPDRPITTLLEFVLVVSRIRPILPITTREESHGRIGLHVVAAEYCGVWNYPTAGVSLSSPSILVLEPNEGTAGTGRSVARQGTAGPRQLWAA